MKLVQTTIWAFSLAINSICSAAMFQGLGSLPGTTPNSTATAISGDGSTVVGRSNGLAFRWTANTGIADFGMFSNASAVSEDGSFIVATSSDPNTPGEIFRWSASSTDSVFTSEDALSFGVPFASSISADGSVIVGVGDEAQQKNPWVWTANTGTIGLPLAVAFRGAATSISADGRVVAGSVSLVFSSSDIVIWIDSDGDGVFSNEIFLDPNASSQTSDGNATAISADGTTVVGSARSDTVFEPFRWTAQTGIVSLAVPAVVSTQSAIDVSGDGSIILGNFFIWDELHGGRLLENYLVDELGLGDAIEGWASIRAAGISDDGLTIFGNGINPQGLSEAWVVTVPEPATLSVLMVGILSLSYGRRRSGV